MTSIWCQRRQAPLCDVQVLNPTLSIQLAALVPLSRRGCGSGAELGGPSDRQLLLDIDFSTLALWIFSTQTRSLFDAFSNRLVPFIGTFHLLSNFLIFALLSRRDNFSRW